MERLRAEAQEFEPGERFAGEYAAANYIVPGGLVTFNGREWRQYRWGVEVDILRYSAALLVYPRLHRPVLVITGGLSSQLQASANNIAIWASDDFGFKSTHCEELNSLIASRFLHTVVQLEDEIYAIGGQQRLTSGKQVFLQSSEVLSLVNHSPVGSLWETAAGLNRPRSTLTAVVVEQRVYALGGFAGEERLAFDLEVMERGKGWRLVVVKHCVLAGVAVLRKDNELWVMGGSDGYVETKQIVTFNMDIEQTRLLGTTLEHPVSLALPFYISSGLVLSSNEPQCMPSFPLPVSPSPLFPICCFPLVLV